MGYGTTRQTFDHQICKTQNQFKLEWTGKGSIDDSPATVLYLKRADGSQGFYLPEQTVIGISGLAVISNITDAYSTSTVEHIEFNALAFRDASGNVTVVIDPATPQTEAIATISIVANTTVQAIEVKVEVVGTPDATSIGVSAVANCVCVYEPNIPRLPAGGASALSTAE
jgi:hypothetical protein